MYAQLLYWVSMSEWHDLLLTTIPQSSSNELPISDITIGDEDAMCCYWLLTIQCHNLFIITCSYNYYKCKNHEIGCRDDTVPKTVDTRNTARYG